MKYLKWIFLTFFLLLIAAALLRAPLFRFAFSYRSLSMRQGYVAQDTALVHYIQRKAEAEPDTLLPQVIDVALIATREQLEFNTGRSDNDPNLLIHSHRANCIGYAAFFCTVCNHILRHNHMNDRWVARHHVGQLYLLGTNVHHYFSDPFFYDHDFAVVENLHTGEIYAVDPSMSDCLLIDYVRLEK
jgi:hypothetical protein